MQWSADRNAGFSRANPQKLYLPVIIDPEFHYEAINVEAQQNNSQSLLWWVKRLMSLRKRFKVFGRGSLEFLYPENRKVLVFVRRHKEECVLVVANLSRFAQCVELDLSDFQGRIPVELFGRTRFPVIAERPYVLTLGSYAFFWFALELQSGEAPVSSAAPEMPIPSLAVRAAWENVLQGKARAGLEAILPEYLRTRRWFGGKSRTIQATQILDAIPVPHESPTAYITLVQVEYTEGEAEMYVLPLAYASEERVAQLQEGQLVIARLRVRDKDREEDGALYEALGEKGFAELLLEAIARHRQFRGEGGRIVASHTQAFRGLLGGAEANLEPSLIKAEQSNTSLVYGDRVILKLFRRPGGGVNPDLEVGRFLTERRAFAYVPPVAGAIEYRRGREEPRTLAILHGFVPNQGDAWQYTLDVLGHYFERGLVRQAELEAAPLPQGFLLTQIDEPIPPPVSEFVGAYLCAAELLGQRTGECHVALASDPEDPNFAPEPFTDFSRRALYHAMLSQTDQTFLLLRQRLKSLPEPLQGDAKRVLDLEGEARRRFQPIRDRKLAAMRIRCHGDYHLGQVLYTGKDFVIIDFEGEPARPLSERRIKRSPLRDVAGMLRSFHYASYAARFGQVAGVRPEDLDALDPLARFWYLWVSVAFLKAYLGVALQAGFLPQAREDLKVLLEAHLLEKALYELAYELNNRPDWVRIPLHGMLQLLAPEG
jgi:maltose alpha-D-glucosyltransferase/alpha-amylase